MKFEFAKATDITEFAKKYYVMYKDFEKVYIVPDTNDYHILRVIKGYGDDYERVEGSYILEHQMIPRFIRDEITGSLALASILDEDDGSNHDYTVCTSLKECIYMVDDGFGIN